MMIFGPLVAPSTSTVTDALPRSEAPEVTLSPSTASTTGRLSVSPTAVATLSISMTSPTATFCCLAPARTIAYTAVSFVEALGRTHPGLGRRRTRSPTGSGAGRAAEVPPHREGTRERAEGQYYGPGARTAKREAPGSSQRLRAPFFFTGTCSTTGLSSPVPSPSAPVVPLTGSAVMTAGAEAVAGGPAGRLAARPRVRVTTRGFSGSGVGSGSGVASGVASTCGALTAASAGAEVSAGGAAGRLAARRRVRVTTRGFSGSGVGSGSGSGVG